MRFLSCPLRSTGRPAVLAALAFAVAIPDPIHATLLWYSPLNGNANASPGANGTPSGSPVPTADRNGSAGAAVLFEGSGSHFSIGNLGTFPAGTLACWLRADSLAGERGALAAGASGGGSDVYFSFMKDASGRIRVDLDDGNNRRDVTSNAALVVGQWYHVATAWSGNGTLRVYVNGVIQTDTQSLAGDIDPYPMTSAGLIGSERATERFWHGALDDAAIWNEELNHRTIATLHGLAKFQNLPPNDPAVAAIAAFSTLGQQVTVGATTWVYVSGLAGPTGTTGGTLGNNDAFIVLDGATGRGVRVSVGPPGPPAVANSPATEVEPTTATIGGQVTSTGGETPVVTIFWGQGDGGTNPGAWDHGIDVGAHAAGFSAGLTGLPPDTTHYFRCRATNSGGTTWAPATATFATPVAPNPPVVVNIPASNIAFTNADLGGSVTDTGGETPTAILYWGDNDGGTVPANWDNNVVFSRQSGPFVSEIGSLAHDSTYYFRCFAFNSAGSSWAAGSQSFTTLAFGPPALTLTPASAIGGTSARLGGTVTETGGDSPNVTLYYGTSDGGTNSGAWQQSTALGIQSGAFEALVGGLAPETPYFFAAFALNAAGGIWATPSLGFTTTSVSEIRLNEFLASNNGGTLVPNQVEGRQDDWIEIHNSGAAPIDLGGWHLSDDPAAPAKWTFPPTLVPAGGFLVVFASGDNAPDANGNLHTGFRLGAEGENLALVRPNLTVASAFDPGGGAYPSQFADISYGLHPITLEAVYFATPTPGAPNSPNGLLFVADTKFSHRRGYYTAPFAVAISSATEGAVIRYTLDGTEPAQSGNGTTYTAPVPITTTTVLRARAFKAGLQPTNIDTQTYLFPAAIATQTRPNGYPTSWGGEPSADYDVDQNVSQTPQYSTRFLQGLRSIPTLSVATSQSLIFGPGGIYSNTTNSSLEAAVSAEYFRPDPLADGVNLEDGFQIDCGFKVQGGASRNPGSSIKHSLSLRFRSQYGAGRLNYPLFQGSEVTTFNSVQLRAMYNNSWIHSASDQRGRATMIRDQFARETLYDLGNADAGRGHFVHLYINGLYWGVHNIHERLENDHYAAYHGYASTEVIGFHPGNHTSSELADFNSMRAAVAGGDWNNIVAKLDVDSYIDYYIVQHFCQNKDLKNNDNWRAAGGGSAGAPWRFYCWDTERTLESVNDTALLGGGDDGAEIINSLDNVLEFRVRFADRAHRFLTNGGPLTSARNRDRFQKFVDQLDSAIVAESARWGDDRSGGGGPFGDYTRDENWLGAVAGVQNIWFPSGSPNRTSVILNNWRTTNWPGQTNKKLLNIDPPSFLVGGSPQHGGETGGQPISASAPSGSIHFTTDGSDPRLVGGAISPAAQLLGASIPLAGSGLVRMRALQGAEWSALTEATFFLETLATAADLAITEVHYHPTDPSVPEQFAGAALPVPRAFVADDFEFVEIVSLAGHPVNLAGLSFASGLTFASASHVLPAGARAVLVADAEAFAVRYGTSPAIAGQYAGRLNNDGERLVLLTGAGAAVHDFTYNDAGLWPDRPDGRGSSLEVVSIAGNYDDPANWRSSVDFHGSPGTIGSAAVSGVVINEVRAHPLAPDTDAIELLNPNGFDLDIGGWFLSDSNNEYRSFRIPDGTVIGAGSHRVYSGNDFQTPPAFQVTTYVGTVAAAPATVVFANHGLATGDVVTLGGYGGISSYNGTFEVTVLAADRFSIPAVFLDNHGTKGTWTRGRPFGLGASGGDDLWLLEGSPDGRLLRFADKIDFEASRAGDTLGRWPEGAGAKSLVPMLTETLGLPNSGPKVGPVILSEILYHPATANEAALEFIEICNTGTAHENLANWRLRGTVDFDFTAAHALPPDGALVLVAFNPHSDPGAANAFRSHYGIDAAVPLAGPWSGGTLPNSGASLRLQRPDIPPPGDPDFFPPVTEDTVTFTNAAPWPTSPDDSADSLQRADLAGFGNFPASWLAGVPNPGAKAYDYAEWTTAFFGPGNPPLSGPNDDFDFDGIPNLIEFALRMHPLVPDSRGLPEFAVEGEFLTLTYARDLLRPELDYQVEASAELDAWINITDVLIETVNHREIRKASVPLTRGARIFLQLRVSL